MKNLFALFILYLSLIPVFSQILLPDNLTYQAVVRDNLGTILPNQSVNFRFTFINASTSGVLYQETQMATTSLFGLVNLSIGTGTPVSGTFAGINFHANKVDLRVEIDPAGGSSFTLIGTSTLTGVPYAQYAERARTVEFNDDADANPTNELQTLSYNLSTQNLSISNGNSVTLNVKDADSNPNNEIQTLSLTGNTLSISSGNSVTFPWTETPTQVYTSKNVGIGIINPSIALDVAGTARATDFWGNGSGLTDVTADSLAGSMQADSGDVLEWDGNQWQPQDNPRMAFNAYASSGQSLPASSAVSISFPLDNGGWYGFNETNGAYDASTGVFTAVSTGVYYFEAQVSINALTNTGYTLRLKRNTSIARSSVLVNAYSSAVILSMQTSAILKLNAGETISVELYNSGSATVTYGVAGSYVYFSGYRIY